MLRRHFIKNTSDGGSIYTFYYDSRYHRNEDLLDFDDSIVIKNVYPSTPDVYNYWTYLGSWYNTTDGMGMWKFKASSIQNFGDLINENELYITLPYYITSLILPEGIENYNSNFCSGCDTLEQVTFPSTLKTLGYEAFYDCVNLKQVVFNENLEEIGEGAFAWCSALTEVILPSTLKTIDYRAFAECNKLTTVNIPDNVTYIGQNAFNGCDSLTTVNSNCGACFIGSSAFQYTPWLNLQSGLITLGSNIITAYDYFTDTEIIIPEWVEGIAYRAHIGSTSATKLVLPSSIKIIGGADFTLSKNPIIEYNGTIDEWCNIKWYDHPDYELGAWALPYILGSIVTDVIFPSNLTTVSSCTFYLWKNLKSVTLHNKITRIESQAFCGCDNLSSLVLPDSIEVIESGAIDTNIAIENIPLNLKSLCVGYDLFVNDNLGIKFTNTVLNIPKTLVQMTPSSIITPNVDTIIVDSDNPVYDSRNNCNAIIETNTNILFKGCKNTVIPTDIDTIGTDAFSHDSRVVSIEIPNNITKFQSKCFGESLKDLYYDGSLKLYCNISKNDSFFTHYNLHLQSEDVKNLIIPSDINIIDSYAFAYCNNIETVVVPANITKIGYNAFLNCPSLSEITLPESLQSISSNAFSKCKLTKNRFHNFSSLDAEKNSYWGATIYLYESNGLLGNDRELLAYRSNVNDLYVSSYFNNILRYYLLKDFNTIQVAENNTVYDSRENCNAIIKTATNELIIGCSNTTIPNSVINIKSDAFMYTEMYQNHTLWEDGVLYLDNCLLAIHAEDVPDKSVIIKDGTRITALTYTSVDSITIPSSIEHFNLLLLNVSQKIYDINYLGTIELWNNLLLQQSFIQRQKNLYINGEKVINLVIPDTITTISSNFDYLTSLITATINVEHAERVCHNCPNLKELTVGENVQTFSSNFLNCPIENLYWNANIAPDSLAITYYKNYLQEVYLNGNFTTLNDTFSNCPKLSKIKISSPLNKITDSAFNKCQLLSSVELPNTLTYIGYYVFENCTNLNDIIIPESVSFVGYNAFNNSGIYNTESNWINDGLYINNCLVAIKDSVSNFVINPDTRLLAYSVLALDNLTSIHIPSSVLYISGGSISDNMSIITVDENNPNFDSRDNCNAIVETATNTLLRGCNTTLIPLTIVKLGSDCFRNAQALQTITIPESVNTIGGGAFLGCSALEEVYILGDDVTLHAKYPTLAYAASCMGAFLGCDALKTISLPQHITLGAACFAFCESLITINYNGTVSEWNSINKPKFWNEGVPTSCKIYCTDGTVNINS